MAKQGLRVATYVRVSTTGHGQTLRHQERKLSEAAKSNGWRVVATYKDDGVSGSKGRDGRPGFDDLCKAVTRRDFDAVAVVHVDRLGRSLADLVTFLGLLHDKGVAFIALGQGIDTTTATGRFMFGLLSTFAEYERSLIQERVLAGLATARERGVRLGRPPVAQGVKAAILARHAAGEAKRAIARALKVSDGTVRNVVTQAAAAS